MHLPINTIHWYIGFPIVLFIGIRGILEYRKDGSKLNKYLGLTGLFYSLCFLAYGVPAAISENSRLLSASTIVGDVLQFIALFFMWLAVVRVYAAKKPFLRGVILTLVTLLFIISVYLSVATVSSSPVTITQLPSGYWNINFPFSGLYSLVTALQYFSFILLSAYFVSQARFSNDKLKKARIYAVSALLFLVGALYVVTPFLSSPNNFEWKTVFLAISLLAVGIFIAATLLFKPKKRIS